MYYGLAKDQRLRRREDQRNGGTIGEDIPPPKRQRRVETNLQEAAGSNQTRTLKECLPCQNSLEAGHFVRRRRRIFSSRFAVQVSRAHAFLRQRYSQADR